MSLESRGLCFRTRNLKLKIQNSKLHLRESMNRSKFLQGKRIAPRPITKETSITELIESSFQAYNAARLREGAQLFAERMLAENVTVGITLTGALTPAGLGISALIPLI